MDAVNKTKRTVVRSQATKLFKRIDSKLKEGNLNEEDVDQLLAELDLKEKELNSLDIEIQKTVELKDLEEEILKCDEYNSNVVIWRSKVKRAKAKFEISSSFIAPTQMNNLEERATFQKFESPHINLPRLVIDKFNGDPSDWQRFWDQFESAIHTNTDISNVDKFNYLRSYLKGIASDAIKGFSLTNNNYQSAVDTLKDRFGKKTIVINSHLNKLLSLNAVRKSNDIISLRKLLDTCQTEIRNLESLGIKEDSFGSLLCPILIRLLPNDIVLEITKKYEIDDEWKISEILKILKSEVISREKAATLIASSNTQNTEHFLPTHSKRDSQEISHKTSKNRPSTASELLNETRIKKGKCFLCENDKHLLPDCKEFKMKQMNQKRDFLRKLGCCFVCFNKGHLANNCRSFIKCRICSRRHYEIMCPDIKRNDIRENSEDDELEKNVDALHSMTSKEVFLQTLVVKLIGKNEERNIRAIIDTGSQFSYILKPTAAEMGFKAQGEEELSHSLFGGVKTKIEKHRCYKVHLSDMNGSYKCSLDVLDKNIICNDIPSIRKGPWIKELKIKGIQVSDVQRNFGPIEVLLGADVAGRLFTGKREELTSGLVALQTKLGWTLLGKAPQNNFKRNVTMSVTSLLSQNEVSVSKLWDLEIIGIRDPIEQNSKEDAHRAVMNYFQKTVKQNEDGRYEVSLPWKMDNAMLRDNYNLSLKRLESNCRKLEKIGLREKYDEVFDEWIQEGIIEELLNSETDIPAHYLPHRPIVKENSTTKIRPVFDASAKSPNHPSLNDCLETGINLIETIPSILARFRVGKIGIVADIKKAFLQISVKKEDRDFLRFLWYNKNNELTIFRHTRVVFGVTSSPFLLSAVLNHHLSIISSQEKETREFSEKLRNSFYVDNCVTSVNDKYEADTFIEESTRIMKEGRFELRGWETTACDSFVLQEAKSNVLGLIWDKNCDSLEVDPACFEFEEKVLTKRNLLSIVGKFFDPIGFLAPVLIQPKLLLQEMWKTKLSWDTEVSEDKKKRFLKWKNDVHLLQNIKIPRWVGITPDVNISFHTFVDASQVAYAACVFIRCEYSGRGVSVQLLQAKARITPLKPITIPRLELMAATIGARLYTSLMESLNLENVRSFFWTDSSTVLAWLKRPDQWSVFVKNRVNEIRKLTETENWFHISGSENIADLPSRGCGIKQLLKSSWWLGPAWLKQSEENWPKSLVNMNEEEIEREKLRMAVSANNSEVFSIACYFADRYSKFSKIVRILAWVLRFNPRAKNSQRLKKITQDEITNSEKIIFRCVQRECFTNDNAKKTLQGLQVYEDSDGVLRMKSRITNEAETEQFSFPIILPSKHKLVERFIEEQHILNKHAGPLILLTILRERFWIIKGRKTVNSVIRDCIICKRQRIRHLEVPLPPLPSNRTELSATFQVTGVDLAGPLFTKSGSKVWIVIFTCAVYRCVHLELVESLSTDAFIYAMRRFIARRGRISVIYSDNGTNFVGLDKSLKKLDWDKIQKEFEVSQIKWKFNPPSAPWWGGFWESLIKILKNLLRKNLGHSSLTYEELQTLVCECEAVMNNRPITYVSEDPELKTLTPSMFLRDIPATDVPDLDNIERSSLNKRLNYLQTVRDHLKKRFRVEYLGFLRSKSAKVHDSIAIGDIVLIGSEDKKRLDWPLGRVIQLFPGKDNIVRLVKLKTAKGCLMRAVQRLYPLEIGEKDRPNLLVLSQQKQKDLPTSTEAKEDNNSNDTSFMASS